MTLDADALRVQLERGLGATAQTPCGAAVLVPLVETPDGVQVLFEVRAQALAVQPGEVSLPGGAIEGDEEPVCAAIRETCEELYVEPSQIQILGSLGDPGGPTSMPFHVFVGLLSDYKGTFSANEVERIFSVPLSYFLETDPVCYIARLETVPPDDFPFELIPGGRSYPWHVERREIPFYLETKPLIWGATARVMRRFAEIMREGASPSAF